MAWFQNKQQKLAVEMWEYVKEQLPYQSKPFYSIERLKQVFARDMGVHWCNDCWLCENARNNCVDCMLKRCGTQWSAFARVCDATRPLEARLKACDEIIQAIKDTDRYYVLENSKLTTVPGKRMVTFEGTLKECLAFVNELEEEDEIV